MKKLSLRIVAASIAIAFAGMSQAQTRHDEKPHGMPGKPSAAPDSPVTDRAPGATTSGLTASQRARRSP